MGFLERAIRRGVSDAVGNAIGSAVKSAVTPVAEQYANKAAQRIDEAANSASQSVKSAAQQTENATKQTGSLEGAFANLQRSMETLATQASQNMKICPSCGEGTTADKKFCPSCGTKLPEKTVADGSVCPSCGKQNKIGTKFCQECGTKLPFAVAEEQAAAHADEEVLAQWDVKLPQYPKWNCGGNDFSMTDDNGVVSFVANFANHISADVAIEKYRELAKQNGFVMAGQYPEKEHLYKMVGGTCYHIDTEHLYEAGDTNPEIYFYIKEPEGGFYYKKPEAKPQSKGGLFDLFK